LMGLTTNPLDTATRQGNNRADGSKLALRLFAPY
jgi:hypothetical protein